MNPHSEPYQPWLPGERERRDAQEARERLRDAAPKLLAACEKALPWIAIATAEEDERHPQAIANAKEDLAFLRAAIAQATREEVTT